MMHESLQRNIAYFLHSKINGVVKIYADVQEHIYLYQERYL